MLLSVAYVSAATDPLDDDDIAALLIQARAANRRNGLTGALIYRGGRFAQILEGPEAMVRSRYASIASDPRHRNVQMMREARIAERQFPQWTMGFRPPVDSTVSQLAGFDNFFERRGKARLEHAENEAQQFLEWLGEYWLPRA
jgi:hypothetical protein